MDHVKIIHHLDVHQIIADRIANEKFGVLVLDNSVRQYQKDDLIEFDVLEEDEYSSLHDVCHILRDMVFKVTQVLSGKHIEDGYVVVVFKYSHAKEN